MLGSERADRAALLIPGRAPVHQSLLTFAEEAIERRGGYCHRIWWGPPLMQNVPDYVPWVHDQVRDALAELQSTRPHATTPLLVGKSLGTFAAGVAADERLPAIWFTPVLNDPVLVAEYGRATAPCMLVGGTGDPMWDGDVARKLSPYVVEVSDADHGMFVPGPLTESGRVHGEIGSVVERFLDEVVWTA